MKTKSIAALSLILLSVFLLIFFKSDEVAFAKAESQPQKAPFDYMFMQRAYPSGTIESGAYKKAALWKKELQKQQNRTEDLIWEFSGPLNIGGRITDIEVSDNTPNDIYVGAASGGIFKSSDDGQTWNPVFDDQPMLSIGDMALAPSNQNIVVVGTGEVNAGGGSLAYDGDGVYLSEDAGVTWENTGLKEVGSIGKVIIHPTDPDIIWVGAMGPLFKNDTNRGVYKTIDGGNTWEQVFFISDKTGVIDMSIHPSNPDILYAAAWERERTTENRDYGGATSGIFISEDGGETWDELTTGLPTAASEKGRISIDISTSNPEVLYASYADAFGSVQGFYKTLDGGQTWNAISTNGIIGVSFHWWFGGFFINPEDEDEVYYMGFEAQKTTNGGNSWESTFAAPHVDQHALAFDPDNPAKVYLGNDGGLYTSEDSGSSAQFDETLPITQFYRFYADPSDSERLYGGTQDNSTMRTTTGGLSDWTIINGGDGFQPLVNKDNNDIIYALSQRGNLRRSTNDAATFQTILNGIAASDRNNWDTPIAFDPQNNDILYYGTQRLYQSTDQGSSWTAISDDLTNGPSSGNLAFGTITSVDVSPLDSSIIYTGADDGNIYGTTDSGATWTNLSASLPNFWVTRVKASGSDPNTVYATFSGYRFGENDGHIFRSEDNGTSWTDITLNLPDIPVNDIELDAFDNVYVGTDIGVFVLDSSSSWAPLGANLPSVVVNDLHFDEASGFLYAATYGRSTYKMDVSADILGIDTNDKLRLSLFPNPAADSFSIAFPSDGKAVVRIYNQFGQEQKVFEAKATWQPFDISSLSSGLYIVQVQQNGKTFTTKLLKK